MSNVGQAALTIVGAVVGSYFGYPQLGFVLGSLAGQALFPTQLPGVTGPKITDNNTTTATVGEAVPTGWGAFAVSGTVIWLAPLRTVSDTQTVGGKGGPEQQSTTFKYFQSIAIGLCESAEGFRRIWENGTLVYDKRVQQEGESDADFNARVSANAKYEQTFVFYSGSESQMPDPTIETVQGVGNVPAFRGLSYVVFPDRQLRDDQGLRHPSFRFEMFRTGTLIPVTAVTVNINGTGDVLNAKLSDYGSAALWNTKATIINVVFTNAFRCGSTSIAAGFRFDQLKAGSQVNILFHDSAAKQFWGMGGDGSGHFPNPGSTSPPPPPRTGTDPTPAGNGGTAVRFEADGPIAITIASDSGSVSTNTYMFGGGGGGGGMSSDGFSDSPGGGGAGYIGGHGSFGWYQGGGSFGSGDESFIGSGGGAILTPFPGGGRGGDLGQAGTDGNISGAGGAGPAVQYPEGSTFTITSPYFLIHGIQQEYAVDQEGGISGTVDTDPVSLQEIINDVCVRAGFNLIDVDASEQADQFVLGYSLSTIMTGRDALTPIRSVGFFDVVERDKQLYFCKRGKPISLVLDDQDMGAYADGDNPPASVSTTITQNVDLPKQIRVHYIAPSRDYEAGEQLSPTKISSDAVQVTDVELAVALDDDTAAQVAEILWADAWAGRWQHGTTLDRCYIKYLPADVFQIPVDEIFYRVRVDKIQDAVSGIRTFSLIRDDDGSYVSTAVAQQPLRGGSSLHVYAPTELVIMDLPPLRFADDNSADVFGAAHRHGTGNTWLGASIFKSIDGGSSWTDAATVSSEATIGRLVSAIGSGDPTYWDTLNSVTVDLDVGHGSFESRTETDVLSGANTLAVGIDGRWLIVQFKTATQVSTNPNRWALTQLLQGRRGTEYLIGTSQVGDHVVLVSGPGIIKLSVSNSELNIEREWRAVSGGTLFADGVDQDFTGHGTALLPFSPIEPAAAVDDGTLAITISWTRRDRLAQILRDGVALPMSEATRAYSIDIIDGSNISSAPVRTLLSSTESVEYTEDQQADDFSGRAAIFSVEIYQLSAVVGRGTPAVFHPDVLANPNAISGTGGGDPETAPFALDKDDKPVTLGYNAASLIVVRKGKKGSAAALGFYSWDYTGRTVTFLGSTYDGRYLPDAGASYIPQSYFPTLQRNIFGGQSIPVFAGGVDSSFNVNYRRQPSGAIGAAGRWLFKCVVTTGVMTDTAAVFDRDIVFAVRRADGSTRAIVAGSPPHVWASSDLTTWADTAVCTGLPNFVYTDGDFIKCVQLADNSLYIPNYVNAAGDGASWYSSPIDSGGSPLVSEYSSRGLIDFAYDGTALIAVMENVKLSDSQTYNVILRSDDGGYSWDVVREVLKASDVAPGFAFNLKWQIAIPYGTGFAIYGQAAFAGSFPYVMISTDHGITWTTHKVDTGDTDDGAFIVNAISHGSIVMAADTFRTVNGVPTTRLSFSTDGITFTSISEFNEVSD